MEYITLNNGVKMPMAGIGTFLLSPDEAEASCLSALGCGYRLIDTANAYVNEKAVGRAMKKSGLAREEIFLETKLWPTFYTDENAVDDTLERLGTDYIDLYLLHQAMKDYFSAWRAMEDAYSEGKLKAIGVSNFYPHVLTNFCEIVKVKPMVNQVELHPYYAQEKALETMAYYDVVPEAWAPLGGGRYNPFENEMLKGIAEAHKKTVGQVILRWNVQRGVVVIPKSTHRERIEENFNIWDFPLTEEEMKQISSLDMGYVGTAVKHFDPEFVRMCNGRKIHD